MSRNASRHFGAHISKFGPPLAKENHFSDILLGIIDADYVVQSDGWIRVGNYNA